VIPFDRIDTVFLDVGNTLVSIDFGRVAAELAARGVPVTTEVLQRAEAASRPEMSRRLAGEPWREPEEPFVVYLRGIVARLEQAHVVADGRLRELVIDLVPALRGERASDLWRAVMPRVPEALARLKRLGLRLAAVSNSDGTAEQMLEETGLRSFLDAVVDSAIVGFEKPDPRIFEHTLRLVGAAAASTLHVGDLYDADVVGARRAGLHALLLDPFDDWAGVDCARAPDLAALAGSFEEARGGR